MDASRFDRFAATLAGGPSRRRLLAAVLGAVATAAGADPGVAKKKGKKNRGKRKNDCPKSRPVRCGETCCGLLEGCKDGGCVDHCADGVKNLGEADVDCGGSCRDVRRCGLAQSCDEDADCANEVCDRFPDLGPGTFCLPCRIDSDCERLGGTARRCFDNFCRECAIDADCPRPGQPAARSRCIEPLTNACPPGSPCVCGECRTSADCPNGTVCDEDGLCFGGCRGFGDCGTGRTCCFRDDPQRGECIDAFACDQAGCRFCMA